MLDKVKVLKQEESANGWQFDVSIEGMMFKVLVTKDYWARMTLEQYPPANLVKKSFDFLLQREPKEKILKSFNLSVIQQYFPEYESTVGVK